MRLLGFFKGNLGNREEDKLASRIHEMEVKKGAVRIFK